MFPIVISAMIVFLVSAAVTLFDVGSRTDLVARWLSAVCGGWSIASAIACLSTSLARAVTNRILIVPVIEGTA